MDRTRDWALCVGVDVSTWRAWLEGRRLAPRALLAFMRHVVKLQKRCILVGNAKAGAA